MTLSFVTGLLVLWVLAGGAALVLAFRREIAAAWREPVLSAPVLIVESDDWGYGPLEQAARLRQLAEMFSRHTDAVGRRAVMTLGVILAGPDTQAMSRAGCTRYQRLTLADPVLRPVRDAMMAGAAQGVFDLQLHGMEHFLPQVLMKATERSPAVRAWLTGDGLPSTEALPARLQSRWIDAITLPSRPLDKDLIAGAALEEVKAFETVFASKPEVAVPPTFIWTRAVEAAWAAASVAVVVTPGRRYIGRDAADRPQPEAPRLHNAQRGEGGLLYLVRDEFFEPALGHRAEQGLAAIADKTALGRPALLETHRANFLGDDKKVAAGLAELDRLLAGAVGGFSALRFMASGELARHYTTGSELIEKRLLPRVHVALLRLARIPRLRKLSLACGIGLACWLLMRVTRSFRTASMPS
jgi:hypothetical protein